MEKILEFLKSDKAKQTYRQLYSFSKTFFTVFIILYAKDAWGNSEGGDIELFNMPLIIINAKWALIGIIRNVWKIGTEKKI